MRILFYLCIQIFLSISLMAQSNNDLRTSLITSSAWAIDECYIDSMLYPKPIHVITHFYDDGSFTRADKDTLVLGPIWSFVAHNELSVTHSDPQFNELYTIVVLEPNVLILRNQARDSEQKPHTIEIRYKPYIKN